MTEVCRRGSAGTRALARALIVKGVLELEADRASDSVATLDRAFAISTQAGYPNEMCWSRLRLLLANFEINGDLDLDAEVADVRRSVELLPDSTAMVGLHVFASEIYAKRGLLGTARSHLAIAQDLNRADENRWLGGLIAIRTFCAGYSRWTIWLRKPLPRTPFTSRELPVISEESLPLSLTLRMSGFG